jgi:hypothetical protein
MCSVCGGQIRSDNKFGVCQRNPVCRAENRKRYYWTDPEKYQEKQRLNRQNYPERHNAYARKWRDKNPLVLSLKMARHRARVAGLPFELTLDTLPPMPDVCPVFGMPLKKNDGKKGPNSPSLDKIIPALGYVSGNVQWISVRANEIKRDASPEELLAFAEWVQRTVTVS